MPTIRVTGAEDPRLADYRGVSEPELARERGLFIAEGRRVVQRLVDAGRARVHSLLVNDAALQALTSTLQKLDADTPVYVCHTAGLAAVAGFNIHRGCLALAERPPDTPVDAILCNTSLLIALEDVANADNVGGVFRNAAAFGADAVLLSPSCCDPLYRKSIRTSMGASLRLPFARATQWPGALGAAQDRGFALVALTPREPSQTLDAFAAAGGRARRLVLLFGAEGAGLSAAAERLADYRVRIPIRPDVDSLNVAVATGIALARLSGEAAL